MILVFKFTILDSRFKCPPADPKSVALSLLISRFRFPHRRPSVGSGAFTFPNSRFSVLLSHNSRELSVVSEVEVS